MRLKYCFLMLLLQALGCREEAKIQAQVQAQGQVKAPEPEPPGLYKPKPIEKRPIRFLPLVENYAGVEFYDTISGRLLKTFDILANNPYSNLKHKVKKRDARGIPIYVFSTDSSESAKQYWLSPKYPPSKTKNLIPGGATSDFITYGSEDGNFAAIGYNLVTLNTDGRVIAFHSTYHVFNSRGEIISTFDHIPEAASGYIAVSDDGKYLFVSAGAVIDCDGDELGKPMFTIYDVQTKEKIYETLVPEATNLIYPMVVNKNMFLVYIDVLQKEHICRLVDIKNNNSYEKTYSYEEFKNLYRLDKNGIFFKTKNGIYRENYTDFPRKTLMKND